MMNSGDLIKKYSEEQQPSNEIINKSTKKDKDYIHYAQNSFKRFMGYEEPDYLRVAGLYAATESSRKSKIYNNYLVKKSDYVAKTLGWYTEDGILDVKRAERAIRNACRTKAPNGLFYMYTMPNTNKMLSDKGGCSIYMSGRRYFQLQEEITERIGRNGNVLKQEDRNIDVESLDGEENLEKVKAMIRRLAEFYNLNGFEEGAVIWVAKYLLYRIPMEEIQRYCEQLTSEFYCKQAMYNLGCPQINDIFDFARKYEKIQTFLKDKKRHIRI